MNKLVKDLSASDLQAIEELERPITRPDWAYCDAQGNIYHLESLSFLTKIPEIFVGYRLCDDARVVLFRQQLIFRGKKLYEHIS